MEFQQHIRANLPGELRTLFINGLSGNSSYTDLGVQMKAFIEVVFDSGVVDEAFSRAAKSFKRHRASAGENGNLKSNSHDISVPLTTAAKPLGLQEDALTLMQTRSGDPNLSTTFETPLLDTFESTDYPNGGASVYDKELQDDSWLAEAWLNEPTSFLTTVPTLNRKRRASVTFLEEGEKE